MAHKRFEYRFKIDAFTPDTIPMARLAEYMAELATLLGVRESVHFVRLEAGSTTLVQAVEFEAIPKVRDRISGIRTRTAPQDAIRAFASIDQKLAQDNATGLIETPSEKVIEFPGRTRTQLERFGSITQVGTLDGVLIRVGGRDETVPVYLLEGKTVHKCNSNRELAKKLAAQLFGPTLRVYGTGKWNRDDFGNWVMERFNISHFELLAESSLSDAVLKLRSIKTGVQALDDPLAELRRIRTGSD